MLSFDITAALQICRQKVANSKTDTGVFPAFVSPCEKYWHKNWIRNPSVFAGYKTGSAFIPGNWLLPGRMSVLGCGKFKLKHYLHQQMMLKGTHVLHNKNCISINRESLFVIFRLQKSTLL